MGPLDRRRLLAMGALACAPASGAVACKRKRDGLTLGLYAAMTGNEAAFGVSTRNGVQIAVDDVNARGGILGKRVWLVYEDTRADSSEAANAVIRLIHREGADALIGEIASSLSLAGGRVANREGVPMVSPSSTAESVTRIGPYVFRVCFIDPFQGGVMARFARESLRLSRVAVFQDQASAYSTGLARVFRETFPRLGGTIVGGESYHEGDTHFSAQLGTMMSQSPEAIFVPGYYTEVAQIANEARRIGYRGIFLGGDGWSGSDALYQNDNDALVGSYYSESFAPEHPTTPRGHGFVAAFRARYHEPPTGLAALGYDAALVVFDAVRRARSAEPRRIRDALAATRDFEGATGMITIDGQRNAVKGAVILAVEANGSRFHSAVDPPPVAR
jgi:branched-chain amino acid transport system substrate-binding protein